MGFFSWLIVGALAGWIASMITGRNAKMGAIANIVVGIAGALIAGYVMSLLGFGGVSGINLYSIVVAIIGATALLLIIGLFKK